ncbi:hypothetical protein ACFWHR_06075 [Leucobacter sp. NPDC058333]|uniref:hypothetical protein n=1 Tax=Leucobacter sp. NPDC058333 TaxID=3346450 RepID=UPI0036486BE7
MITRQRSAGLGIAIGGALTLAFLSATFVLGHTVKSTTGDAFRSPWFAVLYWSVPAAALLCCVALSCVLTRNIGRAAGASAMCTWLVVASCWGAVAATFASGTAAALLCVACIAVGLVAGVLAVALALAAAFLPGARSRYTTSPRRTGM